MDDKYRSLDGSGNNLNNPDWGKADTPLRRLVSPDYADGTSTPSGQNRPNPRDISNIVLSQSQRTYNSKNATDHFWTWGQWVDHDIGLTTGQNPVEHFNISIPKGDLYFDPQHSGTIMLPFERSIYDPELSPRQQLNTQSSFIDSSNVYGASEERARELRTNDGTGKLKTGYIGLLPYNQNHMANAPNSDSKFYIAGDIRANEQPTLTAYHTLWVKEHNRIAHNIYVNSPNLPGDEIYQRARYKVIALNQAITFNKFLPILLGKDGITPYSGYKSYVNPGIYNIFSTACYRLGHSLVSSQLLRLDSNLEPTTDPVKLRDGFFNPAMMVIEGGLDPLLRGAARQACEELNARTVNDLRNFLFGKPGAGGFDLASLNIQRGRDHGLPSYNDVRVDLGLKRKRSFKEVTSNQETISRLASVYDSVADIDVWIGGLAEDKYRDSMLGELFHVVCKLQFEAIRDGDRFWYQKTLSGAELEEVESTRFVDVIRRNTLVGDEIQDNVFQL